MTTLRQKREPKRAHTCKHTTCPRSSPAQSASALQAPSLWPSILATAIKLFAIVLLLCLVCEAARPQPGPAAPKKGGAQAAPKAVKKPAGVQAAPKTVNRPGGGGEGSKQLAAPKAGTAAPKAPPPLGLGSPWKEPWMG